MTYSSISSISDGGGYVIFQSLSFHSLDIAYSHRQCVASAAPVLFGAH